MFSRRDDRNISNFVQIMDRKPTNVVELAILVLYAVYSGKILLGSTRTARLIGVARY